MVVFTYILVSMLAVCEMGFNVFESVSSFRISLMCNWLEPDVLLFVPILGQLHWV